MNRVNPWDGQEKPRRDRTIWAALGIVLLIVLIAVCIVVVFVHATGQLVVTGY